MNATSNYRFSGHDSFQCRYAWLPKAVNFVDRKDPDFVDGKNPDPFRDEDKAMVRLGVGKNMVRSINFWASMVGVIDKKDGKTIVTDFGRDLLGRDGHDEFLENIQTLWLLHWKITTNPEPLFAWDFLLNDWHRSDFTHSEALDAMIEKAAASGKVLSKTTLNTHLDVFLHTYLPTRSRKGEVLEDNLDCPLVELHLLNVLADKISTDSRRREPAFSFRVEEKHEVSDELFAYCLNEFWTSKFPSSETLSFREVSVGKGSPGQVFKLPERYVRERLDRISTSTKGLFIFDDNVLLQQLKRTKKADSVKLLDRVYGHD